MSRREDEKFEAWVEEVCEGLDAQKAEAFRLFAESDAGRDMYRGTIRQNDYYTRLNEFNEEKKDFESERERLEARAEELEQWYETESPKNAALLKERDLLKKQLEELGSSNPPSATSGISSEELATLKAQVEKAQQLDRMLPGVLADTLRVAIEAQKEGYEVDPAEVFRVSLQQGVRPYKAYEHLTHEARAKKYEAQREEERKKWVEEGRRAALSESNGSPDHFGSTQPSVVDFLQRKGSDEEEISHADRVRKAVAALENNQF